MVQIASSNYCIIHNSTHFLKIYLLHVLKAMENQPEGITIFASFLHTHLLGREIYVHHYRNDTELPMISKDEHYDFDYQETRHLSDPVVMKPVSISKWNVMTV